MIKTNWKEAFICTSNNQVFVIVRLLKLICSLLCVTLYRWQIWNLLANLSVWTQQRSKNGISWEQQLQFHQRTFDRHG